MPGVIFYEGKSLIDGKPIVGIATTDSDNKKTRNMIQTWILRSDIHPVEAVNNNEDFSICGDCPLRGTVKTRGCYVIVAQAPGAIFKNFRYGKYPKIALHHKTLFSGENLRFGSYGDPVAIPLNAWKKLIKISGAKNYTGYTHQWRNRRFRCWRRFLMASTHSLEENRQAHFLGWRTFRTIVAEQEMLPTEEIICPATKHKNVQCDQCLFCDGKKDTQDKRKSVAIVVHGADYVQKNIVEQIRRIELSLC